MAAPLGRRRRRTLWAVLILSCVTVATIVTVVVIQVGRRPEIYRPGEEHAEITTTLSLDLPAAAPTPQLVDVTVAAGLGEFRTFAGERTSQLPEDMGSGAAWGDYDNDGDDDLFLVSNGGTLSLTADQRAPSILYENLGNGRFGRAPGFPDLRIIGMAAAWGDYNADGWLDLVVTGYRSLLLFRNDQGRLTRDTSFEERDGYWAGAVWGDYDNDDDLDLYVCGYVEYQEDDSANRTATRQYGTSVPYTLNPSSYEPAPNLLLRNDGDGTFGDVAKTLGVSNAQGRSLSAVWHDFDGDGWLDLYVANDISDNVFYHNTAGTFQEISHAAWVADYRGAMGLAVGDWDRDGDDDLFVTHWIAQENALYDSLLTPMENTADGDRQLRFMDIAAAMGLGQVAIQSVGWGSEFADLDADGWLDLFVANGSTLEDREDQRRLVSQKPFLFWNNRGEGFHNIAALSPTLDQAHVGRGVALSDFDGDGDSDVLIVHHGEGVQLLRNDIQQGRWIKLRLRSPMADGLWGPAYGARVACRVGDVVLRRAVTGASYLSQSTTTLHVGLGEKQRIDGLTVWWPGGSTEEYGPLAAGTTWELREGQGSPRPVGRVSLSREDQTEFWAKQRAAMNAMKVDADLLRAIELFQQALAFNPVHEDSLYYLGSCLFATGDTPGALERLQQLTMVNPQSHRGHKQHGLIRALTAVSSEQLSEARVSLKRALEINPEETGVPLLLGEVDLIRGDTAEADRRLGWLIRTNPRAVGASYLLGYIAWKGGRQQDARELLARTREALGPEWTPKGTTSEGDVRQKMHTEESPLSSFWLDWDGSLDPASTYAAIDGFLAAHPARRN